MKPRSLFAELRRRNVWRAGVLYAAAAWALAQGAAQLLPVFGTPEWVTRWLVIAAIIGFPFWLAVAWFYEFTPSGLKRESEIAPGDSIAHRTGPKLDLWIIGILCVAVVLLLTDRFVVHKGAALATVIPDKSVAVLPLANESGDPEQQYFSDGLSEELIADLTQIDGLKVIGKYSSFKFRDSKDSSARIGAALGVAHLLQGSVRQQGERIRVTVNMISAADGSSVWAHSYDGRLDDVFAIQTQIGQAVAAALQVKLLGKPIVSEEQPASGNAEAYRLMLQGRAVARHSTEASFRQGIALFQQALRLDPDYAYAWGVLSNYSVNLGSFFLTGDERQQAYAQARIAVDKMQTLAPHAATTHYDRGYLLTQLDNDPMAALAEYQRAYALAPHDGNVMNFLSLGLQGVGQLQRAAELRRKAIATDPLRPDSYANLAGILLAQNQLDAAEQAARKALVLQPDFPGPHAGLSQIAILRGDAEAALRYANQETDPDAKALTLALAQQIGADRAQADAALHDYLAQKGQDHPFNVAVLYALRKQPDLMFTWLLRARTQRDPGFTSLLSDPFVLAYQHDPRFAALCQQAGLPLPGQPLAAAAGAGRGPG
ncbi:MAG TPA: hypothetical protein VN624_14305 [Rhodanobacter sp.]|nr:hypothetical protein [Rhodanobacter sp.]